MKKNVPAGKGKTTRGAGDMVIYLLWHVRQCEDGSEDAKLIGVYSSKKLASAAKRRISKQSGFRDQMRGFNIAEYEVNKDYWTEGFVVGE